MRINLRQLTNRASVFLTLFILIACFQNCSGGGFQPISPTVTQSASTPATTPNPSPTPTPSPAPTPTPSPTPTPTPAPAPSPTPTPTPSPAGFPSASNTGIPAGTVLQPASSNKISAPGTYSNLSFTSTVSITASNVTLSNCLIKGQAGDYFEINISGGLSNVVIENCEINGAGTSGQEGTYGVFIQDDSQVTINGVNIHHVGSPITIGDGRILIENCYFHDFYSGSGTHYNGIQYNGGGSADFSLNIQHNTIINQQDQTDAIMIDNYFGAVNNVTVNNNYLSGGSYTVYSDGQFNSNPITNVSFTNNVIGKGGYGYHAFNKNNPVFTGNVDAVTGQPIN